MANYAVSATFEAIDGFSNVLEGITDHLMGFSISATGVWDLLEQGAMAVVDLMEEMGTAMAGVSARTGWGAEQMAQFKKESSDLFATGLVDNFTDAAKLTEDVWQNVQGLTREDVVGFTAKTRDAKREFADFETVIIDVRKQFVEDVAGMAKAWDMDSGKITQAVAAMQGQFQDLAKDPIKALDMLATMARLTGDPLKDITAEVEKYGPKFAGAGMSAMGMGGLIVTAANLGLGPAGIGGLANAVDKFHDKIIKPDAKFYEGLAILGMKGVVADFRDNKKSMDQILDEIFIKMGTVSEDKRAKALKDLFGETADKIGGADTLAKLGAFRDALGGEKGIAGAADEVAKIIRDDGTLGTALKQARNSFEVFVANEADRLYRKLRDIAEEARRAGDNLAYAAMKAKEMPFSGDYLGKFPKSTDAATQRGIEALNKYAGMNAAGGMMSEGWGWVGEEGPELRYKSGSSVEVFSNRESGRMVAGAGAGGGGNIYLTVSAGTVVGSGGMDEFARMMTKKLQEEQRRQGKVD